LIRQIPLLIICFGGVVVLKEIPWDWPKHASLGAWFVLCTVILTFKKPSQTGSQSQMHTPQNIWWGLPKSKFGAVCVALYVFLSFHMFTLNDSGSQVRSNLVAFFLDALGSSRILLFSVVIPIYEEFFFRAGLLPNQKPFRTVRGLGSSSWTGEVSIGVIYINALVFWLFHAPTELALYHESLSHGALPLALGPFFLGLTCALITSRDRSMWWAVALHGFANAAGPLWHPVLSSTLLFDIFFTR
jgi:membrane protease YdiL (CAAX protease family)